MDTNPSPPVDPPAPSPELPAPTGFAAGTPWEGDQHLRFDGTPVVSVESLSGYIPALDFDDLYEKLTAEIKHQEQEKVLMEKRVECANGAIQALRHVRDNLIPPPDQETAPPPESPTPQEGQG